MNAVRRRLDAELVRRKLVASRGAAREAIDTGSVELDGMVASKASTLVGPGASLRIVGEPAPYVSRGGFKLAAALEAFSIDVVARRALDVGASTGGFTDCLLQHGASGVVSLDVGYGQLAWRLRSDPRVQVVERTNIRYADLADHGSPFDVVVADLSFISLGTVAAALRAAGDATTDYVLLVKPQFEVGRGEVGKGGIVRDPELHAAALVAVAGSLENHGIGAAGAVPSPLQGAKGNREFLMWARTAPRAVADDYLEAVAGP